MASAHSIVVQPDVPGGIPQELADTIGPYGIFTIEFVPPIVKYENEFAKSADTEGGKRTRSQPQNPEGTWKGRVVGEDAPDFWEQIDLLEQLFATLHDHKGVLIHTPPDGGAVTFNIETWEYSGFPQDVGMSMNRAEPEVAFTTRPFGELASYWAVAEEAPVTSSEPVARFDVEDVPGSVDALGELVLIEAEGQNRDYWEWGRCDTQNLPAGAELLAAGDLLLTGYLGTLATRAGAYNGGVNNVVRGTPLVPTPQLLCSTGPQEHVGPFRIYGRIFAPTTGPSGTSGPYLLRFTYRVGDGPWTETDEHWVEPQPGSDFTDIFLGTINIPRARAGDQVWEGRVEIASGTPGDSFDLNYLTIIPAVARGRAVGVTRTQSQQQIKAYDSFRQAGSGGANAIENTENAAVGGLWQTGVGQAGAYNLDKDNDWVTRSTQGADYKSGRLMRLGTTAIAESDISCLTSTPVPDAAAGEAYGPSAVCGIFGRYVDSNHWLAAFVWRASRWIKKGDELIETIFWYDPSTGASASGPIAVPVYGLVYETWLGLLLKNGAGSFTEWWVQVAGSESPEGDAFTSLRLFVSTAGEPRVFYAGNGDPFIDPGAQAVLATGGAMDDGGYGLYDAMETSVNGQIRYWDNFQAGTSTSVVASERRALHANQKARVGPDYVERESADGNTVARPLYDGAHLLIPPAGREGRSQAIVARARRTNIENQPDSTYDDQLNLALRITPRVQLLSGT